MANTTATKFYLHISQKFGRAQMFATRLNGVLRYFRQMHTYFNKLSIGIKPETTLR